MKRSVLVRTALIGLAAVLLAWAAWQGLRAFRIRQLEAECRELEGSRRWEDLLDTARLWLDWDPRRREALRAGAVAGRELRRARTTAEFLAEFPRESPDDVPWLTMLSDLQFGPMNQPEAGAATCRAILKLKPDDAEAYRRLVFFYAMTQQHAPLQETVRQAIAARSDLPEFHVYAFLSDSLRLRNAPAVLREWQSKGGDSETLSVAYALSVSRSLEGAIPSVEESQAERVRKSQEQRDYFQKKLREQYPANRELIAYALDRAVTDGDRPAVGEWLSKAPATADGDSRFWRARGWLFLGLNDLAEADRSFARALALHPLDWKTRHYQADLLRRKGQMAEAGRVQTLASTGRALERDLIAQPDVRSVAPAVLKRLADYAAECGQTDQAERIRRHLAQAKKTP